MTDFVVTEKSEKTAVSVLLISGDGGRTALTHRGAASQLEARDLPWQAIQQTRWVHLSNVGGEPELLLRLFDHLSQSLGGLSWNPGSKELALLAKKALLIQHVPCNIFCVNKEEWVSLGSVCDDVRAHVPIVVVTDGKKGGVVYGAQHYEYAYKGEKVATVQETGAGDAFIVGFVSAHLYGLDIASCVRWGNRNAASVVTHIGAKKGLLRRGEIEQMGK